MFDTEEEKRHVEKLINERRAAYDNLTATQERCSQLIDDSRLLKKVKQLFDLYLRFTENLDRKNHVRDFDGRKILSVSAPELKTNKFGTYIIWQGKVGAVSIFGDEHPRLRQLTLSGELICEVVDPDIVTTEKFVLWAFGIEG